MLYSPRVNISFFNRIIIYGFIFDCARFLLLCMGFFSSCSKWGLLFIAVSGLVTVVASLVMDTSSRALGLQQLWHKGH